MIELVEIMPGQRPGKEYTALISQANARVRAVHFGAAGAQQYPDHRDDNKKRAWLARHSPRGRWDDPFSAGFWSRWLLWNKNTLEASARDIERVRGFPVILRV
jgi:hypothetical protein